MILLYPLYSCNVPLFQVQFSFWPEEQEIAECYMACLPRYFLILVVINDYECVQPRNFNTDTLDDFPIRLSTSVYSKINTFSSTTGVLQKDISVAKFMQF